MGEFGVVKGDPALAVKLEARLVELVEADDVVESSGNSTTFHVCRVASGANDTLRFAKLRLENLVNTDTSNTYPETFSLRLYEPEPPASRVPRPPLVAPLRYAQLHALVIERETGSSMLQPWAKLQNAS